MMVPLSVTHIESAIPMETNAAPHGPIAICVASDAGTFDPAMALAGITYCTAALIPMYSTATMATPVIRAMGMVRSGLRISPLTMFRSFQPS